MFYANNNFTLLPESYLFSEVARKVADYRESHPDNNIIRMDIGDVSLPLPAPVIEAMQEAVTEMGKGETFRGYGPEQGYLFLRELIAQHDYNERGIATISADDIFISDGAKSDVGNIGDIFGSDTTIAIAEPAYPVYIDANILDVRKSRISFLRCSPENDFKPEIPVTAVDVIYLCYPNNPTGTALALDELKKWVDHALENHTLIIYDSAYEAYVRQPGIARSIYEIEGADRVAIEVRSFSKTAGFTGVRCGYTVVPQALDFTFSDGGKANLNKMWNRRQSTKFNGVGYIVQCGAAALYTPEGRAAVNELTDYYMENASMLRDALLQKGYSVIGGENSPYIWFKNTHKKQTSWEMFDMLLSRLELTSTPGSGFGKAGEGYLRFTGFNTKEKTQEAILRLQSNDI